MTFAVISYLIEVVDCGLINVADFIVCLAVFVHNAVFNRAYKFAVRNVHRVLIRNRCLGEVN